VGPVSRFVTSRLPARAGPTSFDPTQTVWHLGVDQIEGKTGVVLSKRCSRPRSLDRLAEARTGPNDGGLDYINTVAKLAFRTYQQHQNDDWTSRSLDLIDRLCLEGIPGTGAEFEHFER
jgi:hypothetical protein